MEPLSVGLLSIVLSVLGFLGGYWFREWVEFSQNLKNQNKGGLMDKSTQRGGEVG